MARTNGDRVVPEHGRAGAGEAERRCRVCYSVELGGREHGLGPAEIDVLQAITTGARTWTRVDELAQAGLNGSTLSGLVASRWVEEFLTQDGPCVTLSAWSAEVLGVDSEEKWEIHPGVIDQEDSSGDKTRSRVRQPQEVPRFETRPPPREPGMPLFRPKPIKLPFLYRVSRLSDDVIRGMIARADADPVEEAIKREEWLTEQARLEDGRLDVDPESGAVREVPIVLFGSKIPREKPKKQRGKKRRKRRRSA